MEVNATESNLFFAFDEFGSAQVGIANIDREKMELTVVRIQFGPFGPKLYTAQANNRKTYNRSRESTVQTFSLSLSLSLSCTCSAWLSRC